MEEPERLYEEAEKMGRGDSMLGELRLVQCGQMFRERTALLAANGRSRLFSTAEKLDRWWDHFKVCSVPSAVIKRNF